MMSTYSVWNDQTTCVEAFDAISVRHPHKLALVDEETSYSFAELALEINRRVQILSDSGLKAKHRVAIIAENSAAYLVTSLAIWKAGATLVTIYPGSGTGDLEYALQISDPAFVISSKEVDLSKYVSQPRHWKHADIDSFTFDRCETVAAPGNEIDLALICFSSGSTSRPKAIMHSSTAIANLARTYSEVWHLDKDDVAVICLPLAWLFGLGSTSLAILLSGGTLVLVRRARAEFVVPALVENKATFFAGVTVTFAKLVQWLEAQGSSAPSFDSLRLCISGGEPRNEKIFDRWAQLTGTHILDAYCASEYLPLVTYDPTQDSAPRPGSAGQVVARAKFRVVDESGNEVAPGETGEGQASGPGLMLGYWKDPELTAQVLTEDGWYRTKDLVRVDEDGYVYVVGRLSDVIIRGGTNISPTEIETLLRTHPKVSEAAVLGQPDEIYGERVAAVVVADEGTTADELRAYVKSSLAGYKVPSDFIFFNSLPTNTTTGKIDRRALAASLQD